MRRHGRAELIRVRARDLPRSPPLAFLIVLLVRGTLAVVAGLATVPALLGSRQPVAEVLADKAA